MTDHLDMKILFIIYIIMYSCVLLDDSISRDCHEIRQSPGWLVVQKRWSFLAGISGNMFCKLSTAIVSGQQDLC